MINAAAHLIENLFDPDIKKIATRDGYGHGLVELGKSNPDVVVLCGDLTESTRALWFEEQFPDRFFHLGVAEQNLAGVTAGLALNGKIPFASTFGVFAPGNCWGQIRLAIAYSEANAKIAASHCGLTVGADGATHQALEDMAIMRCLPNMTVMCPADYLETKKATVAAAAHDGAVYLRFGRDEVPQFTTDRTPFAIGRAQVLRHGGDVTIVACGIMVYEALKAAEALAKEDIAVRVIDNHTIKPLDGETLLAAARETAALVTAEEHQVMGGMGSAVAELVAQSYPVPIEMVGVQDKFGESGKPSELLQKYGLTANDVAEAVRRVWRRKRGLAAAN